MMMALWSLDTPADGKAVDVEGEVNPLLNEHRTCLVFSPVLRSPYQIQERTINSMNRITDEVQGNGTAADVRMRGVDDVDDDVDIFA